MRETNMRARIQTELDNLVSSLDGNTEKIREIVGHFINETPVQLQQIKASIAAAKWKEVAAHIHKIKIRYSYLGLDEISEQLNAWENELTFSPDPARHESHWKNFLTISDTVISELKTTSYYQPSTRVTNSLPLQHKRILVAEDDNVNGLVFELFIQELGGIVIRARDGFEAVTFAMAQQPDFIFMDVHMPHFSGIDAIKQLRANGFTCPIISLSASTRLQERQNSIDAGANEFLVKPANRQVIRQTLLKYLVTTNTTNR